MTSEGPTDEKDESAPLIINRLDQWLDSLTPEALQAVLRTLWSRRLKEQRPGLPEKSHQPDLYIVPNRTPD